MRRHLIGLIAILLLIGAVYFRIWPPEGAAVKNLESGCARGGVLAAVLWLAYYDVRRMPPWLWAILLGTVAVVVVKPRTAFLAIPLIIALAILRPRFGRKQRDG